jgi:hypothetical protein
MIANANRSLPWRRRKCREVWLGSFSKIAESQATSLRRGPLAQETMRGLILGFLKKEIQLA